MSDTTLRFLLSDGRHIEVPLGWLREQLRPQGFDVVPVGDLPPPFTGWLLGEEDDPA